MGSGELSPSVCPGMGIRPPGKNMQIPEVCPGGGGGAW